MAEINKLLFCDLETSGLYYNEHVILASGLMVVDKDLKVVDKWEGIIGWGAWIEDNMTPYVKDMHTKNGLLDKVYKSNKSLKDVEKEMIDFVKKYYTEEELVVLTGNSIHFDRAFINHYMHDFMKLLYYREVDISSIKILTNMWSPIHSFDSKKPPFHTPLADAEDSLNELKGYRDILWGNL